MIKKLEQKMNHLCTTLNPHQRGKLPGNTIQNQKNDGHCMIVTTREGKQTIDAHMLFGVEVEASKDDDVIEVDGDSKMCQRRTFR